MLNLDRLRELIAPAGHPNANAALRRFLQNWVKYDASYQDVIAVAECVLARGTEIARDQGS